MDMEPRNNIQNIQNNMELTFLIKNKCDKELIIMINEINKIKRMIK